MFQLRGSLSDRFSTMGTCGTGRTYLYLKTILSKYDHAY